MIYAYPTLDATDHAVLGMIQEQRKLLRYQVSQNPGAGAASFDATRLRAHSKAQTASRATTPTWPKPKLSSMTSCPETLEDETLSALIGYRTAMTYVLRVHDDPYAEVNAQFIGGLHYMMLSYDLTKHPGQWRPGVIFVVRDPDGDVVYEGPEAADMSGG